jgi:hypothetical protein
MADKFIPDKIGDFLTKAQAFAAVTARDPQRYRDDILSLHAIVHRCN